MAAATTVDPTAAARQHFHSGLRFADSFWDEHDRGVEAIATKLRNSKQTCEEIKKLYEIRSQIEEDYGERLLKLSQLIVGQTEEGTLAESLSHIPSALETTGRAHLDLAQQLKHHLELPLDGFLREQRELRRSHHQQIENARQLKNMHHANALKAKEFYTAECTKVAGMEKYLRERGGEMTPDERQQMEEEIDEGRKMMIAAEQEYRHAIEVLNRVTKDWVDTWRASCDKFQEMEEKRIKYIHDSLWAFSTMMSSVYLVDDQCCERIRTTLELTDVHKDINEFIQRYGTGDKEPEMMQFEPFSFMDIKQVSPSSSNHKTKALPSVPNEELKSVEMQLNDLNIKRSFPQDEPIISSVPPVLPDVRAPSSPVSAAIFEVETMITDTSREPATKEVSANNNNAKEKNLDEIRTPPPAVNPEASASASPDEPAVPATPPSQDQSLKASEKNGTVPEVATNLSLGPATSNNDKRPESIRSQPASSTTKSSDLRFKPIPNPAFKGNISNSNEESERQQMPRVDSGNDMQVKLSAEDRKEERDTNVADDGSDDDVSENYVPPPPKPEKWLISSIRRPQQLPVQAQNAKMFDGQPQKRNSASVQQDNKKSVDSTSATTNNKLQRSNPPPKIEIPYRTNSNNSNNTGYAATQVAAQQVIAAGRAQAQQASAWQRADNTHQQQYGSSVYENEEYHRETRNNNTYGYTLNVDNGAWQQPQPQPYDGVDNNVAEANSLHGSNSSGGNKKNHIGSFVKGVLKHDHPTTRPSSDNNKERHSFQPASSHTEKSKEHKSNRFSLGIFGGGHKKKQHKQEEQPASIAEEAAAEPQFNMGVGGGSAPVTARPVSSVAAPVGTRRMSAAAAGGRPVSMMPYHHPSPTLLGMDQRQRMVLEDGTPVIEYVRAVWSYEAKIPSEMSFMAGDLIAVIHKQPDGWWQAELMDPQTRRRGLVPGNYMEAA